MSDRQQGPLKVQQTLYGSCALTINNTALFIYSSRVIFSVNRDYFFKQH
jgi:hypothetical protein